MSANLPCSEGRNEHNARPIPGVEGGTIQLLLLGECAAVVNGVRIDHTSTHLFALLLLLSSSTDRRRLTRVEIQRYLFDSTTSPSHSSHNLRQLLYRLRRLHVRLSESRSGVLLHEDSVLTTDAQLRALLSGECEGIHPASVLFLPSYSPRLPAPFLEWVERLRERTDARIRTALLATVNKLRTRHSWHAVLRVSSTLHKLPRWQDAMTR